MFKKEMFNRGLYMEWLNFDGEPGTLEYAKQVQIFIGGIIKYDDGWYWVDSQDTDEEDGCSK